MALDGVPWIVPTAGHAKPLKDKGFEERMGNPMGYTEVVVYVDCEFDEQRKFYDDQPHELETYLARLKTEDFTGNRAEVYLLHHDHKPLTGPEECDCIQYGLILQIRNQRRVEVLDTENYEVVGQAYRTEPGQDWFVGAAQNGRMYNVATVNATVPEVLQRKMILAILKTAFNIP